MNIFKDKYKTKEKNSVLHKRMSGIFPPDRLCTNNIELSCYGYDASENSGCPDCAAFPVSADEVSQVMRLAEELRVPVVPRGAGSGFTGGSVPIHGGIVLCFSKMNRIIKINNKSLTAVVEPGVVNSDLKDKASEVGLFYPPDPASFHFSTIGGNLGECAGGPMAVKYGVTRDYVMAVEAVLANGDIIRTGRNTFKGVAGYDLCNLLVGSEGTLAIITEITLRLISLPESRQTILSVFKKRDTAAEVVTKIITGGVVPCAMELIDKNAIACVREHFPVELPEDCEAALIIEVDGHAWSVEREFEAVKEILFAHASAVMPAETKDDAAAIWKARRMLSPTMRKFGNLKLNEDIVVPLEHVPEILRRVEDIGKKLELRIICFGHAGDGNIHVNIMVDRHNKEMVEKANKAVKEVFEETIKLGGTISGEHGIGLSKAPYLSMELQPETMKIMQRIKACFDPKGILNPGKIFPSS